MKRLLQLAVNSLIICLALSQQVFADLVVSPVQMLDQTSQQMLSALKQERAELKKDPQAVYRIVNEILVPHVDLDTMARSVLGRDAWLSASDTQRQAFTEEFKTLLIRTYASALSSYTDERVIFQPIRGGYANQTRVQVQSQIIQHEGPAIPVSYRLVLQQGNIWKVYDFSVDGVSIVESFRSQFADELNQGGLDQLLTRLKQHNNRSV